ncbi:integrase domain-containing protein [Martelella lutilitoris]|uniref:Integrase domain-containing protein n=1 Tax=Martelella lutilitoris TaxID=2583532 RepID=A0A7T7KNU1_9HYPH|nr:phage integrase N-terminal domain-containing protein [Martelella lutilitoris]QQM32359.1 integrase domain-containing protein [Martelella lutilitoris]
MDDLTMDLTRLCRRNRDGSYGTQANRLRGLTAMANELRELGYRMPAAKSLKSKHVDALVEKWLDNEHTDATIRNRLTWLRWWAEKVDKSNVIHRDNARYGVNDRTNATRNRAKQFSQEKFNKLTCPYIKGAILLQAHFGLRREEAMKFRPQYAIGRDLISLKASWTKGGRPRVIPITTLQQRQVLQHLQKLVPGDGSLIPPQLTYVEQLKQYEYQTLKAGMRNTHGFRHTYAQQRYKVLTGQPCPINGGKLWQDMTPEEKTADRTARQTIALELGHGRISITDTYLGSAAR